ncbi:MAG: hypothetical protein M0Z51_04545 [Propionibacterium sp.]|nr:hypothetical protein [Propionibacterium sp.]
MWENTTPPADDPDETACASKPVPDVVNGNTTLPELPYRDTSSAAPAADFTSHTNWNPAGRTSTCTSTPGTTSANVAVDPDTTGSGNTTPGNDIATDPDADESVTTGSPP